MFGMTYTSQSRNCTPQPLDSRISRSDKLERTNWKYKVEISENTSRYGVEVREETQETRHSSNSEEHTEDFGVFKEFAPFLDRLDCHSILFLISKLRVYEIEE